jgi:hypothetical protein
VFLKRFVRVVGQSKGRSLLILYAEVFLGGINDLSINDLKMLTKLEIQLYSIVHTLSSTQRAQTQDKCNACIRSSYYMSYSKSWVRING